MQLIISFISGVSVGIEFFSGEDLHPEDKFAMTLDIFIIRLSFVLAK